MRKLTLMMGAGSALAALVLAAGAYRVGESEAVAANRGNSATVERTTGGISDPVRFVLAAYGLDKASPDRPGPPEMLDQDKPEYSPRLRELFAIQQREHGKDEVGRLSMDIYTGTQDGDLKDIKVKAVDVYYASPPRKVLTATFTNMGRPTMMHFYFEKIGDKWFLDDIATQGEGTKDGMPAWTLSLILKYGWQ